MFKFRVYNEKNYDERMHQYFATYFKTKREAVAYAEKIGNATIEKRIAHEWVAC